jgi:Tfp pilus assembly protein PilF
MDTNLKQIFRSELFNAYSYLDRLFHALNDLAELNYHPGVRNLNKQLSGDLRLVLDRMNNSPISLCETSSSLELRQLVGGVYKFFDSIFNFDGEVNLEQKHVIDLINVIYQSCYDFHYFCYLHTDLIIELPRGLQHKLSMKGETSEEGTDSIGLKIVDSNTTPSEEAHEEEWMDEKDLVLFQIDGAWIDQQASNGGTILSFNKKRLKKFQSLLHQGHELITVKNYDQALFSLEQARYIDETAEVLTLIGWCYSLMNKVSSAKKYCLKAIEVDPDYGPSYNDLGTYLMNEGDLKEALRWFELAKNAPIYQNKEYPYINMGRVFLMQKKYRRALLEFKEARKRAPFAKNLIDTISKIESLLQDSGMTNSEVSSDHINKMSTNSSVDRFPWEENPLN